MEESRVYELASVLFMDIVSYSLETVDRQAELVSLLQNVVRQSPEFQRASANQGELIVRPTGDGMALVFTKDPVCPVRCALEIAKSIRSGKELKIRMGIHLGPVSRHVDITEQINVVGGGINVAQRVMDCGDAGHILLSGDAARVLTQLADWSKYLHNLGVYEVKHDMQVHLWNLRKDGLGNSQEPRKPRASQANATRRVLRILRLSR
jgi:class 3 adenylate cyclase